MDHVALCLFVVILHVSLSSCQSTNQTSCTIARNCRECIQHDPTCAWCTDSVFNVRCDIEDNLISNGCINITNPQSSYDIIKNETLGVARSSPLNKTIQVQPQIIKLRLRKGEPQRVTLSVRPAEDYPLDLYYLMDLSRSMEDDLRYMQGLGNKLARELQKLSSDVQMGFGSFIDKLTLPYLFTDSEKLEQRCNPDKGHRYTCAPAYGVRNSLSLTHNLEQFAEMLNRTQYSAGVTDPEGGMDALMQMVVCKDMIGWRDTARKMLVYTSDNTVHAAGDGRLGAIYAPNDGLCHLDPVNNEYTETITQDFPSIGHLNSKILEHNIYPTFAVTAYAIPFYQSMAKYITGATVGRLAANSKNIINIIKHQYNTIISKIELVDSAPEGINIAYTAHCGDGDTGPGGTICTGLELGQVISFDLDITATSCKLGGGRPGAFWRRMNEKKPTQFARFYVKPFGLEDKLLIEVEVTCSCECEETRIPNSGLCSDSNGALVCGQCDCNPGRYGKMCECDTVSVAAEGDQHCQAPNSTVVCSGRGQCHCGECKCFPRQDPDEIISGPLCECDNFSCDRYEGELCGGPARGTCVCDDKVWTSKCQCHHGYVGDACQCPDTDAACMATTGLICNGFGTCMCGKCACDENSSFRGPTCENCGICMGKCGLYQHCVMCTVFEEGHLSPEECAQCSMLIVVEKKLHFPNGSLKCEFRNEANCTITYYYETLQNGTDLVHVQQKPACSRRTVVKIEPWIIVVSIISAIVVIGLLIIILLRLYIYYLDKKEYAAFEKERNRAKWDTTTNPLYIPSTTTHVNPMYGLDNVGYSKS